MSLQIHDRYCCWSGFFRWNDSSTTKNFRLFERIRFEALSAQMTSICVSVKRKLVHKTALQALYYKKWGMSYVIWPSKWVFQPCDGFFTNLSLYSKDFTTKAFLFSHFFQLQLLWVPDQNFLVCFLQFRRRFVLLFQWAQHFSHSISCDHF